MFVYKLCKEASIVMSNDAVHARFYCLRESIVVRKDGEVIVA